MVSPRVGRYTESQLLVAAAATLTPCAHGDPVHLVKAETSLGYHTPDYSTVGGAPQLFAAETVALGLPLAEPVGFRLDTVGGTLSGGTVVGGVSAHVYLNGPRGMLGVSAAQVRLTGGIQTNFLGFTGAVYEDELLTACFNAGYEAHSFGDDLWFGELYLRLYPNDRWLFSPGVSYAQAEIKQTRADIILNLEYLAVRTDALSLVVYAQYGGNLFTKGSVGVTLYFDQTTFRDRDRTWGPPLPRFK